MPNRNINSSVSMVPTNHLPRTKRKMPFFAHYTSAPHGYLVPFFIKQVYPSSVWEEVVGQEIVKENSLRPVMDDIYHDTYFFYVPFRIIDPNWRKILGDRDDPLDTNTYSVPSFNYWPNVNYTSGSYGAVAYDAGFDPTTYQLPFFMGYSHVESQSSTTLIKNKLSCYPIWAFWKIWNFFFRDENLQAYVDAPTILYNGRTVLGYDLNRHGSSSFVGSLSQVMTIPKVGRYHDYFSNGTLSPQRGPEVLMHLDNELAPVGVKGAIAGNYLHLYDFDAASTISLTTSASFAGVQTGGTGTDNMTVASFAGNGISIDQFRIAMMTTALYERRNMFGSRYDEYLRGIWGLDVPDSLIDEPEYLGGERVALSQIPVFNQSGSGTGEAVGVSNTGALAGQFSKTFLEHGYVIGVHCFRVKHTYGQGFDPLWQLFDELDFYNPIFANASFTPRYIKELWNTGEDDIDSTYNIPVGDLVWNYNEAWMPERIYNSIFSGLFNPDVAYHADISDRYVYADIYGSKPTYSETWLGEPVENIVRTLTGDLIPYSTNLNGNGTESGTTTKRIAHQYLCKFGFNITKTMPLPDHSVPVTLLGRL